MLTFSMWIGPLHCDVPIFPKRNVRCLHQMGHSDCSVGKRVMFSYTIWFTESTEDIYIYTCENIKQLLLGKARAYFLRHRKPCDIEKKSFWSHNIQDESWIPSHVCSILLFLLLMNPNRGLVTSPAWLGSSIYGTWIFCHARESKIKHTMIWYITYPLVN
jgi:hypothetical protein